MLIPIDHLLAKQLHPVILLSGYDFDRVIELHRTIVGHHQCEIVFPFISRDPLVIASNVANFHPRSDRVTIVHDYLDFYSKQTLAGLGEVEKIQYLSNHFRFNPLCHLLEKDTYRTSAPFVQTDVDPVNAFYKALTLIQAL